MKLIYQSPRFNPENVRHRVAVMHDSRGAVKVTDINGQATIREYLTTSDKLPVEVAALCAMRYGILDVVTEFPITKEHPVA